MTAVDPPRPTGFRLPPRWRPPRWTLSALLIWTVLGVALRLEHWPLLGLVSLAGMVPIYLAFVALGTGLALACLVATIWRRGSLIAAVGFVAAAGLLVAAAQPLTDTGAFIKFLMVKGDYDKAIRAGAVDDTGTVRVDEGPPVRVGFVWARSGHGWAGVVHDESGIVMTDQGRGKPLFRGFLLLCRPLQGPYYFCSFA